MPATFYDAQAMTMQAGESLIAEIEEAVQHGSPDRRADTLRSVTDLFLGSSRLSDDQVALFDDVIRRLIDEIEIKALVARNGGRLHEVIGSRREVSLDARALRRLIPDVGGSDVYLCGPGGFTDALAYELSRLHVSSDQIHKEEFSF